MTPYVLLDPHGARYFEAPTLRSALDAHSPLAGAEMRDARSDRVLAVYRDGEWRETEQPRGAAGGVG